ncbi:L,D-transpeptidase [Nonomuraea sp. NPDC050790]|uniref:L,D-transpeptidase n=1 Tax=Nonomuraea sp. NPDC050790 TaxID=3364371 RepID=UPI0037B4E96D
MSPVRVRNAGIVLAVLLLSAGAAPAGATRLPYATTHADIAALPADPAPFTASDGVVLHPAGAAVVRERPAGRAVAMLPARQLGNPTWVPVVERVPGWARVLLPARPNGSTGWVAIDRGTRLARSTYLVRVDIGERRLTLLRHGHRIGGWRVAVGARETPTPVGRTFVLGSLLADGSLVLPTGAHSDTLDRYGGGPGTVALHGWPDPSVYGKAISHGCVRVPEEALRALAKVPLGTLVLITI